jgi:hypothetical protein
VPDGVTNPVPPKSGVWREALHPTQASSPLPSGAWLAGITKQSLVTSKKPAFQRYFRWNQEQRTRFVESILLGIPIPPIFVAEDGSGVWELVDGLQRVSTILSFFGVLRSEDEGIKSKNGWSFNSLPSSAW